MITADVPMVGHLTTRFPIERGLVQHQPTACALIQGRYRCAIDDNGQHLPFGGFSIIAKKVSGPVLFDNIKPDRIVRSFACARPRSARLGLLLCHGRVEPICINSTAFFAQGVLCQIKRKSKGVIQFERRGTLQRCALGKTVQLIIQELETAFQRLLETGFLETQGFFDQGLGLTQLRIGGSHFVHQRRYKAVHHRIFCP